MTQYVLDTALRRTDKPGTDKKRVIVLSAEEFHAEAAGLPHKKAILHELTQPGYSRAALFGSCIVGTVCMPPQVSGAPEKLLFGFYLRQDCLYLIGDAGRLGRLLARVKELPFAAHTTLPGFFCTLLNAWLDDDVLLLQQLEDKLEQMEETLLERIPTHFYRALVPYRKTLMALRAYYYQLTSMAAQLRANTNSMLDEEDGLAYGYLADRAERLHHHVETLGDYVLQIREMHQTQVAVRQSKAMNLLTVVSAIFLPLTLLVGWYGMNFAGMPELQSPWGYPLVIAASVVILAAEIAFFHRKHML